MELFYSNSSYAGNCTLYTLNYIRLTRSELHFLHAGIAMVEIKYYTVGHAVIAKFKKSSSYYTTTSLIISLQQVDAVLYSLLIRYAPGKWCELAFKDPHVLFFII